MTDETIVDEVIVEGTTEVEGEEVVAADEVVAEEAAE